MNALCEARLNFPPKGCAALVENSCLICLPQYHDFASLVYLEPQPGNDLGLSAHRK